MKNSSVTSSPKYLERESKSAYSCSPWSLREGLGLAESNRESFCYFSQPETYDGDRSMRRPGETMYWKITDGTRPFQVLSGGRVVGILERLSYYHFDEPTESFMFEYRLVHGQDLATAPKNDGLVLCKIFCEDEEPPPPGPTYSIPEDDFIAEQQRHFDAMIYGSTFSGDDSPYVQDSPCYAYGLRRRVYTVFMQFIDPLQHVLMLKKHNIRCNHGEYKCMPSGCFFRAMLTIVQAYEMADEGGVFVLLNGWPISKSSRGSSTGRDEETKEEKKGEGDELEDEESRKRRRKGD